MSITTIFLIASVVVSAILVLFSRPRGGKEPAVIRMESDIERLRERLPLDEANAARDAREKAAQHIDDLKRRVAGGEGQ